MLNFRAAILIRTIGFTKNQLFWNQERPQCRVKVSDGERQRVYFSAIWSAVVILGPRLSLPALSNGWMRAWSTHQGSHNISSYTQAALTGCQSVWREMLLGQTVFSLRQIPIHWQAAIITSLSLVVTLFLTSEKNKKFNISTFTNFFSSKSQWVRSQHAQLKVPLSEAGASWLTGRNTVLIFTNHMLPVRVTL